MNIKTIIKTALPLVFCLIQVGFVKAQMVGPNAYIKATSLEIGIDGQGGFEGCNSGVSPPLPGMHPRGGFGLFGFVANPQVNGWATFDGDFFVPGTPENGWGLEVGSGTGIIANNNSTSMWEIPGAMTNWSHFFSCYSATWDGNMTNGSSLGPGTTNLHVKINYLAQETDLYYTTTVSITNNTSATIPEIYYHRNVDPDNNQPISGDFSTDNTIVSQPGTGCNLAHVKATSVNPPGQPMSYLGFAGVGSNFRVTYGGFSNRDASDLWAWTNAATYFPAIEQTVGATLFSDDAISLAYKITNLAPGATETFKYVVILDDSYAAQAINNLLYFSYPGSAMAPPPACTPYTDTVRTCGSPVSIGVSGPIISDFNWTWSPPTGLSPITGPTVTANPATTTTYTVTGTPLNPCYAPVSMQIVVQVTGAGGANPFITPVPIQCVSSPAFNMTVDTLGGVWSGTGITNPTLGTFDPAVAGTGTYTILYVTPALCNNSDTVIVIVNAADATITQPPVVCANDPAFTLSAVSVGGTWSGTGITSATAGTFDPVVSGPGIFTISYSLTGVCATTDTVLVTVGAVVTPVTGFSYTSPVCVSGSNPVLTTVPSFSPGGTFTVSPASGLSINPSTGAVNLAATTAGTYVVTYTVPGTICGPAGISSDTIVVNPVIVPVLNFSYPAVCHNGGVNPLPVLGAGFTTGGTFSSTSGVSINPVTGEIDLSLTPPGSFTVTYTVTGSNAVGVCTGSGSSTATAVLNATPTLSISAEETIWIGTSTTVYVSGGTNYVWSPTTTGEVCFNATCDSLTVSPPFTTNYCVVVTDANGCKDSTCTRVRIETPCPSNRDLVVPNAFTPNGDGNNDELCLDGWDDCVTKFEIFIYDRWGEKVFSSDSPHFCWDGIYKGKVLDPAVFVYYIKATYLTAGATINDAKGLLDITKKGNISLVR